MEAAIFNYIQNLEEIANESCRKPPRRIRIKILGGDTSCYTSEAYH